MTNIPFDKPLALLAEAFGHDGCVLLTPKDGSEPSSAADYAVIAAASSPQTEVGNHTVLAD